MFVNMSSLAAANWPLILLNADMVLAEIVKIAGQLTLDMWLWRK